jgi:hypothetical protein
MYILSHAQNAALTNPHSTTDVAEVAFDMAEDCSIANQEPDLTEAPKK